MGCMPYGPSVNVYLVFVHIGFNPSYGLHALRAIYILGIVCSFSVSIPHMGCMPYGLVKMPLESAQMLVSIPHMGCMPYGP